jgi:hypothetical protein
VPRLYTAPNNDLPVAKVNYVRAAVATNVTLVSAVENGDSFGGVTLATGDRVGLFGQSAGAENGIYTVNASGAPTRATDFNLAAEFPWGLLIGVKEGTLAGSVWMHTTLTQPPTLGTTALTFVQVGDVASHLADTADAHDASAVSFAPAGGIAATDVQAALAELDTEKAAAADLTAHMGDTSDAHDASAVSYDNTTSGMTATNVQDAIDELEAGGGGGGSSTDDTVTVHNDSGGALTKGTVVSLDLAATAGVIEAYALDGTIWDTLPFGVVEADIANGATGSVKLRGVLSGLDTSAWAVGNPLYPGASGALTTSGHGSGLHVAVVLTVHATTGSIYVLPGFDVAVPHGHNNNIQGGLVDIASLTALATADPAADMLMIYDDSAGVVKKVLPEDLGIAGGGMTSFTLAGDGGSSQTITDGNTLTVEGGNGIDTTAAATDKVTVAVALTTAEADLGADVTMTTSGTGYDGPSISLAAGTWLIVGTVTLHDPNEGVNFVAKLWDGTTVESSAQATTSNGFVIALTVSGIVSPGSTTTYKITVTGNGASSLIKAAATVNGAGNNASHIRAIRIA